MTPRYPIARVRSHAEMRTTFDALYELGYQRGRHLDAQAGWESAHHTRECFEDDQYILAVFDEGRRHIWFAKGMRQAREYIRDNRLVLVNSAPHLLAHLRRHRLHA